LEGKKERVADMRGGGQSSEDFSDLGIEDRALTKSRGGEK